MTPRVAAWRAAAPEAADVTRLLVAFRDWLGESSPSETSVERSVAILIDSATTEYLLAAPARGESPSAVCQLRFRHSVWTATEDCWLEDLFVAPTARRHGLGAALVTFACERAAARGAARIELDTNEDNTAAIALYESLGFSTRSKAHGHLQGRDLFMGRRLSR